MDNADGDQDEAGTTELKGSGILIEAVSRGLLAHTMYGWLAYPRWGYSSLCTHQISAMTGC